MLGGRVCWTRTRSPRRPASPSRSGGREDDHGRRATRAPARHIRRQLFALLNSAHNLTEGRGDLVAALDNKAGVRRVRNEAFGHVESTLAFCESVRATDKALQEAELLGIVGV